MLIRLKPMGPFFFGDESVNADDGSMFYLQRSRQFPQQTTVLGMLRHQLLLQNNQFDEYNQLVDKQLAEELIGKRSFDESPGQTFGAIRQLDPVFLVYENQALYPMVHTCKEVRQEDGSSKKVAQLPTLAEPASKVQAFWSAAQQANILELVDFGAKTGLETRFLRPEGASLGYDELFKDTDGVVGIRKPQVWRDEEQTAREGFFKMYYQHLHTNACFACKVRLNKGVNLTDNFVMMGKERSLFWMSVEPYQLQEPPTPNLGTTAVWLLSDARVDTSVYVNCQVALTETVNFRNIRTDLNTVNHFARPNRPACRRELLQRGSLLFPKKGELHKLEACLNSQIPYQAIGYNHYIVLS